MTSGAARTEQRSPAGWLAFFYFSDEEEVVEASDPESWAGARVLHLPPHYGELPERSAPGDLEPYDTVPLTVEVAPTVPGGDTPALSRTFGFSDWSEYSKHPVGSGPFNAELDKVRRFYSHQVLGNPHSIQGPVELEVAHGALGAREVGWNDPRVFEEAQRWVLLAQFDRDGDAGMAWGDCGVLYWLIRPEDLAENRFEKAMFTWQCC
ncbi:DUF1963 domain-containing protein [Streptomyces sp. 3N207]|uniref:DUF1963 domain-containing protein n=1 Tax=Streptomyces sp. 3N207 TaxID=3457417 RepID=UPI003FD32A34